MTRSLLDVSVLLALVDPNHVAHERSHEWFATGPQWATCAVTQNGFVRIISQPRYPNSTTVGNALSMLEVATSVTGHEYWQCEVSILDRAVIERSHVLGPGQLTDSYLLGLAVSHGGRLVTLDTGMVLASVIGAQQENLLVL